MKSLAITIALISLVTPGAMGRSTPPLKSEGHTTIVPRQKGSTLPYFPSRSVGWIRGGAVLPGTDSSEDILETMHECQVAECKVRVGEEEVLQNAEPPWLPVEVSYQASVCGRQLEN